MFHRLLLARIFSYNLKREFERKKLGGERNAVRCAADSSAPRENCNNLQRFCLRLPLFLTLEMRILRIKETTTQENV